MSIIQRLNYLACCGWLPLEALPMRSNGGRAPNPCNRPSHVKGWPQLPRQGPEWPLAPLLSPQRLQQDSDRLKYAPSWAGHLAPDAIQAAGSVSKALHGLKSVKPYEGPQRPLAPAGGVSAAPVTAPDAPPVVMPPKGAAAPAGPQNLPPLPFLNAPTGFRPAEGWPSRAGHRP